MLKCLQDAKAGIIAVLTAFLSRRRTCTDLMCLLHFSHGSTLTTDCSQRLVVSPLAHLENSIRTMALEEDVREEKREALNEILVRTLTLLTAALSPCTEFIEVKPPSLVL